MAPKRAFAGTEPKLGTTGKFEGEFNVCAEPPFLAQRLTIWEKFFKKHQDIEGKKERRPIRISMLDGRTFDGIAFETTPLNIAEKLPKSQADSAIVAKLVYSEPVESLKQCVAADNDDDSDDIQDSHLAVEQPVLWDLNRPLEGSCSLELLSFDHPQGQDVFWHSSAHILGQALERQFGCHLTIGPALEQGFYYDGFFGPKKIAGEDYKAIEGTTADICKENQRFERCVLTKADALELFANNPFKVQLIQSKVPEGAMTSCYRCGPLIDLCRGPHIQSTGKAKAFMITKNSAAYWLGDQNLDSLQRIYGMAFPSKEQLKEYKKFLEEAEKRDHRNIGRQQELFFHHPTASPGSTFWFPMGARIYNKLVEFIRSEYRLRNFHEVITPNMYTASLFMISGHYQNYKDDMYSLNIEDLEWMLKPMNCPGHFLMFDQRARSYKELPLRYADFGVLHRNEASGALSGLTRVRRFQQDDAHIFIRPDQIREEVLRCLDFVNFVYDNFGFKASFALSTRPKKALGSKELWDNAESQLKQALNDSGLEWSLNPGDGAFYGPKIDIRLQDTMKRKHQCGTIQLDFNNPIRFNLQYRTEASDDAKDVDGSEFCGAVEKNDKGEVIWREGRLKPGFERPVVVHRAILGSVERCSAILMEHYAGKWPFWLSPRQVIVIPVTNKFYWYAKWVERQLMLHGFHAEADVTGKMLNNKIRVAQESQWNYICVVGESEMQAQGVTVRKRDEKIPMGMFTIQEFLNSLNKEHMPMSQQTNVVEKFIDAGEYSKGETVNNFERVLEQQPYVKGFGPSQEDLKLYETLCKGGVPTSPHMRRWFEHIDSFSVIERSSWPDHL